MYNINECINCKYYTIIKENTIKEKCLKDSKLFNNPSLTHEYSCFEEKFIHIKKYIKYFKDKYGDKNDKKN